MTDWLDQLWADMEADERAARQPAPPDAARVADEWRPDRPDRAQPAAADTGRGPAPTPQDTTPPVYVIAGPPEPSRWEHLTVRAARIGRPWQIAVALALAVTPVPWTGFSAAVTWHYCVTQARADLGTGWGYAVGTVPLTLVVVGIARRGGSALRLWLLAVTVLGVFGAMSWYDPIQLITGVSR